MKLDEIHDAIMQSPAGTPTEQVATDAILALLADHNQHRRRVDALEESFQSSIVDLRVAVMGHAGNLSKSVEQFGDLLRQVHRLIDCGNAVADRLDKVESRANAIEETLAAVMIAGNSADKSIGALERKVEALDEFAAAVNMKLRRLGGEPYPTDDDVAAQEERHDAVAAAYKRARRDVIEECEADKRRRLDALDFACGRTCDGDAAERDVEPAPMTSAEAVEIVAEIIKSEIADPAPATIAAIELLRRLSSGSFNSEARAVQLAEQVEALKQIGEATEREQEAIREALAARDLFVVLCGECGRGIVVEPDSYSRRSAIDPKRAPLFSERVPPWIDCASRTGGCGTRNHLHAIETNGRDRRIVVTEIEKPAQDSTAAGE